MNYRGIAQRVRRLERQDDRKVGYSEPGWWYELLVAPSCPPDKRLHIRGGIVTPSARWGWIMTNTYMPDTICDFENEAETQMDLVFTNANYYLPILLCYYGDWVAYSYADPDYYGEPVFENVLGTEVATAAEAEAQIDALMNGTDNWYYYVCPLWAVMLKNDGQVGVPYAILPIDHVNRGRSYLYRDIRARHNIFG